MRQAPEKNAKVDDILAQLKEKQNSSVKYTSEKKQYSSIESLTPKLKYGNNNLLDNSSLRQSTEVKIQNVSYDLNVNKQYQTVNENQYIKLQSTMPNDQNFNKQYQPVSQQIKLQSTMPNIIETSILKPINTFQSSLKQQQYKQIITQPELSQSPQIRYQMKSSLKKSQQQQEIITQPVQNYSPEKKYSFTDAQIQNYQPSSKNASLLQRIDFFDVEKERSSPERQMQKNKQIRSSPQKESRFVYSNCSHIIDQIQSLDKEITLLIEKKINLLSDLHNQVIEDEKVLDDLSDFQNIQNHFANNSNYDLNASDVRLKILPSEQYEQIANLLNHLIQNKQLELLDVNQIHLKETIQQIKSANDQLSNQQIKINQIEKNIESFKQQLNDKHEDALRKLQQLEEVELKIKNIVNNGPSKDMNFVEDLFTKKEHLDQQFQTIQSEKFTCFQKLLLNQKELSQKNQKITIFQQQRAEQMLNFLQKYVDNTNSRTHIVTYIDMGYQLDLVNELFSELNRLKSFRPQWQEQIQRNIFGFQEILQQQKEDVKNSKVLLNEIQTKNEALWKFTQIKSYIESKLNLSAQDSNNISQLRQLCREGQKIVTPINQELKQVGAHLKELFSKDNFINSQLAIYEKQNKSFNEFSKIFIDAYNLKKDSQLKDEKLKDMEKHIMILQKNLEIQEQRISNVMLDGSFSAFQNIEGDFDQKRKELRLLELERSETQQKIKNNSQQLTKLQQILNSSDFKILVQNMVNDKEIIDFSTENRSLKRFLMICQIIQMVNNNPLDLEQDIENYMMQEIQPIESENKRQVQSSTKKTPNFNLQQFDYNVNSFF